MKYNVKFCAECDNRLEGGYCRTCNFHPSMQDTYIQQMTLEEVLEFVKEWVASPNGQEAILDSHNEAMRMIADMTKRRSGVA